VTAAGGEAGRPATGGRCVRLSGRAGPRRSPWGELRRRWHPAPAVRGVGRLPDGAGSASCTSAPA